MNRAKTSDITYSPPTAYFLSEGVIRSRSVSPLVMQRTLAIPMPLASLVADWRREVARLGLEIGDIEPLPLARTIVHWPDYAHCVEAVSAWMQTLGLPDLLGSSEQALMACLGTHYHHDAAQYGSAAFCNLFLSEDRGMDLHFPALGKRVPLTRGTAVIFDTAQPHAVIPRSSEGFRVEDFASDQGCMQVFLTWELPIEHAHIKRVLQLDFDVDNSGSENADSLKLNEEKVCLNGAPVEVCPATGRWLPSD
jgi:hypothetical protein